MRITGDIIQNREVRKESMMGEIMSVKERIHIREKTETPNAANRKNKEGAQDTLLNLCIILMWIMVLLTNIKLTSNQGR